MVTLNHANDLPGGVRPEETILIHRVLRGEPGAFELLLAPCLPAVKRFAFRVLRNAEDAEEAMQLAALRAYLHLAKFRREARFSTWFYQIARNEIYQIRRKNDDRQRRFIMPSQQDGPDLSGQWPDAAPNQLEILQKRELKRGLEALVGYLPGGLRRAFLLNCVEGLTTRETATRMALSVAAVKSRVFRARQFLRTGDCLSTYRETYDRQVRDAR